LLKDDGNVGEINGIIHSSQKVIYSVTFNFILVSMQFNQKGIYETSDTGIDDPAGNSVGIY